MDSLQIRSSGSELLIDLKVHPRARRNRVSGVLGGALKLEVTAPPENGRANEACLELLAEVLDVSARQLHLVSGQSSSRKCVAVRGVSEEEVRKRIGSCTVRR